MSTQIVDFEDLTPVEKLLALADGDDRAPLLTPGHILVAARMSFHDRERYSWLLDKLEDWPALPTFQSDVIEVRDKMKANGRRKREDDAIEDAVAALNDDLCVLQIQGKVKIVSLESVETNDGDKRQIELPVFSDKDAVRTLYANQFEDVTTRNDKGEESTKRKPIFDLWLKSEGRATAKGFIMAPGADRIVDGKYNLWQGFAVEPKKGKWPNLAAHIDEVVGAGIWTEESEYILRWMAWVLQNPTKQAEVVLVLKGEKGAGKGIILNLLRYIFGAHGLRISDRKHLVGNFNRHLQQVCFLFADEAFWPGDKQGEGVLKSLVTESAFTVEPKGIDAYEAPNRLSIAMASNESWVVPASENERRYAVFDVSDRYVKDFGYFGALVAEIYDQGGAEAFLYDMLHMDLKGWHPRQDIPETEAMQGQKAESADRLITWLGEILDEGCLPETVLTAEGKPKRIAHPEDPSLASAGPLMEHAKRAARKEHLNPSAFWEFLKAHGIVATTEARRGGRWRQFPPLAEARAIFQKKHPWRTSWSQATHWRSSGTGHAIEEFVENGDGDGVDDSA